ncbi:Acetyltransferase (GNAT) family protein [Oceanobacillus limi]|uniref:Acetyltransferase (GNAT) family protein n=1 Tax=Oceanobacillus limi TaxID=930131 RepID=A0A1I0HAL5_9BACI|nr:GNAT family N-acetyltransferase [Oceanobacillus limi]SET80871.1 Acetyltransferase (GNAT) family protein [Oceanobacillus limi]
MLQIKVIDEEEVGKASDFIAQLNNNEESHIGYCGKDKDEIAKYMMNEISDVNYTESFVVAYEGSELIGILGFDADLEDNSAEIWGPFITPNKWGIVYDMWRRMTDLLPSGVDTLEMFPNMKNTRVFQLAKDLSFQKYSDETVLLYERNTNDKLNHCTVEELSPEYYTDMKQLHDSVFPSAYYNGQQIMKRLNEHRKVFIIINKGVFAGYIYVEAEPEFGEASIEFFAVEDAERGNGVGGQLLKGALKWLFTFEGMESITLCVNAANVNAINLYRKVGFQYLHDLCSFTKEIR